MRLALSFGLVLIIAGYLLICWRARDKWDAPTELMPVVVRPPAFDVEAARAELVSDDLLIVAALFPEQRKAGEWS